MKDNLSLKFLLDEQERLISAEESVSQWRNTFITHLFTGSGIALALWANILRNALSGTSSTGYSLTWTPPILLMTGGIFLFIFLLSCTCWYRMLNGTATLSIIRAKRFYIKRELSKIGYGISGYYSDDINVADGANTVLEQVTGFTPRTSVALRVFMVYIIFLGAIISHIVAHVLIVLIALPTLFVYAHLLAGVVWFALLYLGNRSFLSVTQKTIVRVKRILGSLASQEIDVLLSE